MTSIPLANNLEVAYLEQFYAVTKHALYKVRAKGNNSHTWPSLQRIKEHEPNEGWPLGTEVADQMLSVGKWLQLYIPEKYSMVSPLVGEERRLEMVNTMYWGGRTAFTVAMFRDFKKAEECFLSQNLETPDPRWKTETDEIIELIGELHPTISVCHYHELALCY